MSGLYVEDKGPHGGWKLAGRLVPQNQFWEGHHEAPRRKFLHLAASAAVLPAVSRVARTQAYPARPVRIVVGFAAGGGRKANRPSHRGLIFEALAAIRPRRSARWTTKPGTQSSTEHRKSCLSSMASGGRRADADRRNL